MTTSWIGWVHWDSGQWKYIHETGNMKGKVNGFEASNALDMLGTIVCNVVHIVHG